MLAAMLLILSGVMFTLFAKTSKPKVKPHVDFDDLAPGLNIDLRYYLTDDQLEYKKRRKKEEMVSLLNS